MQFKAKQLGLTLVPRVADAGRTRGSRSNKRTRHGQKNGAMLVESAEETKNETDDAELPSRHEKTSRRASSVHYSRKKFDREQDETRSQAERPPARKMTSGENIGAPRVSGRNAYLVSATRIANQEWAEDAMKDSKRKGARERRRG
ncbi:hypothetical protein BU16DRAFT_535483 [Lophium mytilinum]|uniref:Uncharacterized protein n=1 Tax=Lophium mytilinum TaxID=390894 RepID=A0A6A6R535_9PEZI|nr:hypothetical protein BU16DRAFT_535483 [Lophium mytilinum]